MASNKYGLEPKQAMFVIEYVKDLNATQAYIRAGYSKKGARTGASILLANPNVKKAVQEQLDAKSRRTLITADYIIDNIREVAERCMQHKPVMEFDRETGTMVQKTARVMDEQGNIKEVGVYEFDSTGANKALENLARHQKLLTDKTEIGNADGSNIQFPEIKVVFVESKESLPKE
ncbi:terminase small subunit [Candidatus Dependentiae bacterium]|nr:MAG: terminase small subunit [Candidatus Dependentiae bacterium]